MNTEEVKIKREEVEKESLIQLYNIFIMVTGAAASIATVLPSNQPDNQPNNQPKEGGTTFIDRI